VGGGFAPPESENTAAQVRIQQRMLMPPGCGRLPGLRCKVAAACVPPSQVVLCHDRLRTRTEVLHTLIHELVHAWDDCTWRKAHELPGQIDLHLLCLAVAAGGTCVRGMRDSWATGVSVRCWPPSPE
jgi:hypothetical protein